MRLFVGLALPEDVTVALGALCTGLPRARWVAPENMHVTLRFLGELDGGAAAELDAALAAVEAPAFELAVSGLGTFEGGHHVHALWAGLTPEEALAFLAAKVESAVVRAGFEPERRKFKAHVTLARLKDTPAGRVVDWMAERDGFHCAPFAIQAFQLYRSHLGKEGANYEVLADYPLKAE